MAWTLEDLEVLEELIRDRVREGVMEVVNDDQYWNIVDKSMSGLRARLFTAELRNAENQARLEALGGQVEELVGMFQKLRSGVSIDGELEGGQGDVVRQGQNVAPLLDPEANVVDLMAALEVSLDITPRSTEPPAPPLRKKKVRRDADRAD